MTSTTFRTAAAALAACAAIATSAGTASAAGADVTCSGNMSATTVSGNLIVAPGSECVFSGGLISGDVIVKDRAFLSLQGAPVDGKVVASGTSMVSLDSQTTVAGSVVMDRSGISAREANTGGVISIHQSRVGSITATGRPGAAAGLVDVRVQDSSVVAKDLKATWANVSVLSGTVRGNLSVSGGELGTVTVMSAKLYGNFSTDQAQTQVMCRTTIRGEATFEDAQGLYVGDTPPGKVAPCAGNSFKKSLTVNGSSLGVFIGNRVSGVADGEMNNQLVLRKNTFSGGTSGDFAG